MTEPSPVPTVQGAVYFIESSTVPTLPEAGITESLAIPSVPKAGLTEPVPNTKVPGAGLLPGGLVLQQP